jgi:hypothetical protein
MAESGGNPNALNDNANTGDESYGLWQMNLLYDQNEVNRRLKSWGVTDRQELYDPQKNANAAYALYKEQGFRAWSVYKSGKYLEFM